MRVVMSSERRSGASTAGSGAVRRRTNSAVRLVVKPPKERRIVAIDTSETSCVCLFPTVVASFPLATVVRGVGLWARWVAMHGVPRAFTRVQGLRGDPLARLIASHGRGTDPYPLMEEIRARGPLLRTPFTWVTVDHGLCREVLRDKCFGVTAPSTMGLPRLLHMLISRTDDPAVANPVEPLAMVVVDPPQHTRYRQLVAQSFTPRAIDALSTRVAEVTNHLIDRLAGVPHPDLIADFATQLPVAIIAEILDLPADTHLHMLEWGHSGAHCSTSGSAGGPTGGPSPACAPLITNRVNASANCVPVRLATIHQCGPRGPAA